MPAVKNYYKELGVSRNASAQTIEEAWKQWKRDPNNHPDTHPDPNVKARVESEFQHRSAAYLVLSNPADRRRHDADLRARDAAAKSSARESTGAGAAYDSPDPGSEDADWGDGPAAGKQPPPNYSPPVNTYNASGSGVPYGKALKYLSILILAVAILMVIMYFVLHALSPIASSGTIVPQTTPSPSPASVATGDTPTPAATSSPTPTPSDCPVGSPVVTVLNVVPGSVQYAGTAQESQLYTVTGKIDNPTSVEVQIGEIGFYVGQYENGTPPSWTDTLSSANMTVTPSSSNPNNIPSGNTVSFTEQGIGPVQSTSSSTITASLEYPSTATSGVAKNWSWIGNTAGCSTVSQ